jgi:predicted nucleic acid-binding protein
MPVARYLVDTSAWIRYPEPKVGARLDELMDAGTVASCGIVELQLLGSITDSAVYAKVAGLRRASVEVLEMTGADFRRALEVQGLLVERGLGRVGWAALLVAAVAERYELGVLHCDRRLVVISKATGQELDQITKMS